MLPDLRVPWRAVDPKNAENLAHELAREVGPQHVLFGKKARAVAVRQDCDDVLFVIEGFSPSYAVVHLTWIMKKEAVPNFPSTVIFSLLKEWRSQCMVPDAEDWDASA
jgi:hypothetical protein